MLYQLKQHVWSWTKTYDINDAQGQVAFQVVGKFLSWGNNLTMTDRAGGEVATIHQTLFAFMPHYELRREGKAFADITKKFTWFKNSFELDVPGPNDYTIEGSFWDYEYKFLRGGRVVAKVSKAFWSWGDTYGVEIVDGEDDISILATVVVVDLCCHEDKNNS